MPGVFKALPSENRQSLFLRDRARQLRRANYINLFNRAADLARNPIRSFRFVELNLDFDIQHDSLRHVPIFADALPLCRGFMPVGY